ncbi:hypothetical protein HNP84_007301 [Thermocatellispora tengchongensis]|uniref:Uncharacterized protein n=1 Tax=Thermocatellispora tengchongensis TaxID=1073253 RepID=A0A840PEZ2_9ACTN|nr:hypothetical protein [Thermocatellispora tengchongensis]MBB5137549.1 hypothetical protein [Thermocatellispora tengchongensis]
MERRLCQVCARTAYAQGRIWWLLPRRESEASLADARPWTTTPPTCRSCIRLAMEECPILHRDGAVTASVLDVTVYALTGDMFRPNRAEPIEWGVAVPLGWAQALRNLRATQLGVLLIDLREEVIT